MQNKYKGVTVLKKHRITALAAAAIMAFAGISVCSAPDTTFVIAAEAASKLKAPKGFTADVSGSSVTLKWKKVSGANAYRVYRYNTKTGKYETLRTTTKTSAKMTDLTDGKYRFRVAALIKKNRKYTVQTKSSPLTVTVAAKEENMTERITVNTQSSIRIDCKELIIRIDPFRISGEPHDADIVLITHAHYDHYSPDDLKKVCKSDTVIAAPKSMQDQLSEDGFTDCILLSPDEKSEIRGISVETVRAYNLSKAFHPKSNNWLGYIVTALGNRIYAAGDTDATPEAKKVKCDIALVPIGGTYTMDAKEAAELINTIKPTTAIPIHYGSIVGSKSDGDKFAKLVDKSIKVEIK